MTLTRQQHARFLDREIAAQLAQFQRTAQTAATQLLAEGRLYAAQFLAFENGQMVLRFAAHRPMPRKNEYLLAFLLPQNWVKPQEWGNTTYQQLLEKDLQRSETYCMWLARGRQDSRFMIAGFRGISLSFAQRLNTKCAIFLGDMVPPLEYLNHLKMLVEQALPYSLAGRILDIAPAQQLLRPDIFPQTTSAALFIAQQLQQTPIVMLQGPPGTGKTHLMADLCALLLSQQKSVLLMALTNRALIEVAEKQALQIMCLQGKVQKTNLTIDEQQQVKGIEDAQSVSSQPGNLMLATFYKVSELVEQQLQASPLFDVVIVDEASQGLLATFAMALLFGKQQVWVGDPAQMPPIVLQNEDEIKQQKAEYLIEGFATLCANYLTPFWVLNKTYRLPVRAATFTSLFYTQPLVSIASPNIQLSFPNLPNEISRWLHPEGGPTLIVADFEASTKKPLNAIQAIGYWLQKLQQNVNEPLDIAVLTHYRSTVQSIQQVLYSMDLNNVLIDTVARVQGLTCDICIYLVVDTGYIYALEQRLFNVASSRARRHTIIIAHPNLENKITNIAPSVRSYLSMAKNALLPPQS